MLHPQNAKDHAHTPTHGHGMAVLHRHGGATALPRQGRGGSWARIHPSRTFVVLVPSATQRDVHAVGIRDKGRVGKLNNLQLGGGGRIEGRDAGGGWVGEEVTLHFNRRSQSANSKPT